MEKKIRDLKCNNSGVWVILRNSRARIRGFGRIKRGVSLFAAQIFSCFCGFFKSKPIVRPVLAQPGKQKV